MPLLILFALIFLNSSARAETPSFGLPVKCTPGDNCWIVNYVDTDPEPVAVADFTCGPRTYDAHNGTDFAIPDLVAMEMGVDVIAPAPGKVERVRDGVEDKTVTMEERERLLAANEGCGNGVFIDHGDGWQTIYCHMKKDSVAVKPGQAVKAGTKLGEIGNSGIAEFPHLHFGIFKDNSNIDPFTGRKPSEGCTGEASPLWDPSLGLAYVPAIIASAGFRSAPVDFDAIKIDASSPDIIPANARALVFWGMFYGLAAGDRLDMTITDPSGSVFAEKQILQDRDRARQFYFIGKKNNSGALAPGTYTGRITLTRPQNTEAPFITETTRTLIVR